MCLSVYLSVYLCTRVLLSACCCACLYSVLCVYARARAHAAYAHARPFIYSVRMPAHVHACIHLLIFIVQFFFLHVFFPLSFWCVSYFLWHESMYLCSFFFSLSFLSPSLFLFSFSVLISLFFSSLRLFLPFLFSLYTYMYVLTLHNRSLCDVEYFSLYL